MTLDKLPTTIESAQDMLCSGAITAVELANLCLEQIRTKDSDIHAFLEVYSDVLDQAAQADKRRADGFVHPLLGVPLSIKDNILCAGHTASAASKILENYVAPYSSDVVEKLQAAGAVIIGRVNMDEFAMGSSCEYSAYGPTRNPLDLARVPGGSSGGSAASVAAGMCVASIGTDTAGSVRLPASFCGVCGLYPTYGSCSRYGLIAMGSSLDQPGPVATTVDDCQILFNTLNGFDDRDAQSVPESSRDIPDPQVRVVGVPRALLHMEGVSDRVRSEFDSLVTRLEQSGYQVRDIDLSTITACVPVYYVIIPAEVSTNLSRMDGMRFGVRHEGTDLLDTYMQSKGAGFGPETQRRMLLGAYVLSAGYRDAYYTKATQVRELIRQEIFNAFTQCDVILNPTTTMGAFEIGSVVDPVAMYMMDIFTVPANLSGCPALSIPYGSDTTGLPLGVQVMGPRFGEERLFALGKVIEGLRA